MIIHFKLLIAIAILACILTTSCSILERVVYNPNINQGNHLSAYNISKIKNGMTQEQIIYILGTPMLKEPFGKQIWYYIFRQQLSYKKIKQQTLIITFDINGICVNINNKISLLAI